ncbi:MAG: PspC domain-containing protein [Anaerosomatales bacterium]|nr:PspC domain-containing protein [Anaerosomatales bacterium]
MTEQAPQHDQEGQRPHKDNRGVIIIGVALVAIGAWLLASNFGFIPVPLRTVYNLVRESGWALALIIGGAAIIMWARDPDRPNLPPKGTKLYRSRRDEWFGGVLGGLASYFDLDSTVLRLAFIALGFLLDWGPLVVAYIVMWIVVPEEPEQTVEPGQ